MIVSFLWWWTSPVNKLAWQNSTQIFGFWSTKPLDVKGAWFMAFSRPLTGFVTQIRCPDFSLNSWQSLPQQDHSKWTLAEPKQIQVTLDHSVATALQKQTCEETDTCYQVHFVQFHQQRAVGMIPAWSQVTHFFLPKYASQASSWCHGVKVAAMEEYPREAGPGARSFWGWNHVFLQHMGS